MIQDIKTIWHLVTPNPGQDHQSRLEHFYKRQASHYDQFRKRLLPGRPDLFYQLNQHQPQGKWLDVGAGTGSSLDFLNDSQIKAYDKIILLDLSPSLIQKAQVKIEKRKLNNVQCQLVDIHDLNTEQKFDLITLSYALTMMPLWPLVLEKVYALLQTGGLIGVVDFYISDKHPSFHLKKHSAWQRNFWPIWFSSIMFILTAIICPIYAPTMKRWSYLKAQLSCPCCPLAKSPTTGLLAKKGNPVRP